MNFCELFNKDFFFDRRSLYSYEEPTAKWPKCKKVNFE